MMKLYEEVLHEAGTSLSKTMDSNDTLESLQTSLSAYFAAPDSSQVPRRIHRAFAEWLFDRETNRSNLDDRLRLVFLSVDKDASGTVEKKELIDHMERLDKQLSRAEIENLVKFIDKDGDGELTLEELRAYGRSILGYQQMASRERIEPSASDSDWSEATSSRAREKREEEAARHRMKIVEAKKSAEERQAFVMEAMESFRSSYEEGVRTAMKEVEKKRRAKEEKMAHKQKQLQRRWQEMLREEEKVATRLREELAKEKKEKERMEEARRRMDKRQRQFKQRLSSMSELSSSSLTMSVEGRRRMASSGYPVAASKGSSAAETMASLSRVYLTRPLTCVGMRASKAGNSISFLSLDSSVLPSQQLPP